MPDQRSLIEAVHVALFQEIDHMPEAVFIRNRLDQEQPGEIVITLANLIDHMGHAGDGGAPVHKRIDGNTKLMG